MNQTLHAESIVRPALPPCARHFSVIAVAVILGGCVSKQAATESPDTAAPKADAVVDVVDAAQSDVWPDVPDLDAGTGAQDVASEAAPDADAADLGDVFADDGEIVQTEEVAVFDADSETSVDSEPADVPDVHVVVAPPSSGLFCNCWPDGDDCDVFFDMVDWQIEDLPPCAKGEVCTGDFYNRGECLAACWHPDLPDQNVGVQCDPSEYCFLRKLYNWESEVIGQYGVCYPKQ